MDGLEYCLGIPGTTERKAVISALSLAGMYCAGEGRDCPHFLRLVRSVQPHLAIMEISLPGNVLETAAIIDQESLTAVLLLENKKAGSYPTLSMRDSPNMVLSLPVNDQVLTAVVDVLYREFQRRKKLQGELRALKERLQGRIVIEQAKGLVMKKFNLEEQQAYRLLQKKSMELRMPLEKLARAVLQGKL
ncbi:MAG: ANTAR domain-containing protein [Bacillota bacterium]|jgi:response regulator NasT